ncbi:MULTISPECIES: DUF6126 family protein [unclassified Streptomyces]|uniref:DUF6126 family protein n=1 Tax=unclassified Streptomyces TaxID=2593676 RepID=UPI003648801A
MSQSQPHSQAQAPSHTQPQSEGENVPHVTENTGRTENAAPTEAGAATDSTVAPDGASVPTLISRIESKFPRGLIIRLIAYLFVGHLFAFFVYLLFVLGAENQ